MKLPIVVEQTDTSYSARSTDLDGCIATGATREEELKIVHSGELDRSKTGTASRTAMKLSLWEEGGGRWPNGDGAPASRIRWLREPGSGRPGTTSPTRYLDSGLTAQTEVAPASDNYQGGWRPANTGLRPAGSRKERRSRAQFLDADGWGVLLGAALIAAAPATAGAQQPPPLTIGGATARAGQIASGFIEVPAGVDAGTQIPITLVRGRTLGPTLALVAGTHGSEVAPILALQRVRRQLDPALLRGTVILVHVANLPSFLGRTIYYSPVDGKNLNRVYPGRADGTVSERIAYAITREVIARADYLVDMHAGDGNESLRPYTYWDRLGLDARVDSVAREMALAWGHDHIVVDTTRPRDPARSVYTTNTAMLSGKPAITSETGYLGVPAEEMIQRNERGVFRLLRYLRMLPGDVEMVEHPVWLERMEVLRSPATGIWYPLVERGHTVERGTLIGYVTDFFGTTVAEIRSPLAGEMMYVVATPATSEGEPVGMVARPRGDSR